MAVQTSAQRCNPPNAPADEHDLLSGNITLLQALGHKCRFTDKFIALLAGQTFVYIEKHFSTSDFVYSTGTSYHYRFFINITVCYVAIPGHTETLSMRT